MVNNYFCENTRIVATCRRMKRLFSEIISPLYALFEQKSFVFAAICHWVKTANVFHWVLWNYIKHKWWLSIRLSININLRLMGWKDVWFLISDFVYLFLLTNYCGMVYRSKRGKYLKPDYILIYTGTPLIRQFLLGQISN